MHIRLKNIILLISFVLISLNGIYSQSTQKIGLPIIYNYSDEDIPFISSQIWAITQNKQGLMYFGSNDGIIEYDGVTFRHIPVPNGTVRSLSIDSTGIIYVGSAADFGYLKSAKNGNLIYTSLTKNIKQDLLKECWRTYSTTTGTYFFASRNNIFKYHNKKIIQIKKEKGISIFRGFNIDNHIFAVDEKLGFLKIEKDSLKILNIGAEISKYNIYSINHYKENKYLIGTSSNGLYIMHYNPEKKIPIKFKKFKTNIDDYLIKNKLYYGLKVKNEFYFATLTGGVVQINKNGALLKIINKMKGLRANGTYFLYADKEQTLWVGQEKGISKIYINLPFSVFNEKNGISGKVSKLIKIDKTIHLLTYEGVYYLPEIETNDANKIHSFIPISKEYIYGADFLPLAKNNKKINKQNVLIAALREVVLLQNKKVIKKITNLYGSNVFAQTSDGYIYIGHPKGIAILKHDNKTNNIEQIGPIKNLNYSISTLQLDEKQNLWVGTAHNGVVYIQFKNKNKTDYDIFQFGKINGLPNINDNDVYLIKNKLYVLTQKGIYHIKNGEFKKQNTFFEADTSLGFNYKEDSIRLYHLAVSEDNSIWFSTSKGFFRYPDIDVNIKLKIIYQKDPDNKVYIASKDSIVWFLTPEIIYRYNIKNQSKYNVKTNNPLIRKILINEEDEIYLGKNEGTTFNNSKQEITFNKKLNYNQNSIQFVYASPYYQFESKTQFRTKLKGYDEIWTNWSKKTDRSFTNLKEGKYIFKIQSKNIYEHISDIASVKFVISPPWYRSIYAYISYIILIVLIFYFSIKLRTQRLIKYKDKLEEVIRKRTIEITQQKEEIKAQAEKLAYQADNLILTNNELKHLSLVAQETDNSVVILDKKGNFEWWNKGFSRLFKYRFEELKDADFRTKQKKLRPDLSEKIKNYSRSQGTITYTSHEVFSPEHEIWYQTTLNPVYDENDIIFRFVAVDIDITQVKKAEREIREQRNKIKEQRDQIKKKNEEIQDSILYAKRIQDAMLPLELFVDVVLPEHFILFKPLDIVSGDFYWVGYKNKETIFAVADCTGHGIPGAFMSMLAITLLKEVIARIEEFNAATILNELRNRIILMLHQRGKSGEASDGLDIALCVLDEDNNKLKYAGANNPLYIVRKIKNSYEFKIYKPDKMPIGIHYKKNKPFTNHVVKLTRNDSIYLFTDGYVDQFGGPKQKKFFSKRFRNLLLKIQNETMETQKEILEKEFIEWKGFNPQVDDVLVMGIKIY